MPRRLVLILLLACVALVACGPAPAAEVLTRPAATPAPQREGPTLAPSPAPSQPPATRAIPSPTVRPALTPTPAAPRVGVQVGHWKIKELPDEQGNIRGDSGTYYRGSDEWEVNIEIAQRLQRRLEAAGVIVDLLPATVPAAYQADAFVSIHCDGVSGALAERRRGWKAATPFRSSPAAEALLEAVEESYGRVTGMPQDTRGASFEMRAYYAFAAYRYRHTIAPTTPAIIVEAGFVTHPEDRALLFDNPDLVAQGIAEGLLAYLAGRDPAATRPQQLPTLSVVDDVTLFERPSQGATVVRTVDPGEALVTLSQTDGWYLVTTREGWDIGWVRASDVQT